MNFQFRTIHILILVSIYFFFGVSKNVFADDLKFNGYLEGYYSYNTNSPSGAPPVNTYRRYDSRHNTLTLNYVELATKYNRGPVGLVLDLAFGPMSDDTNGVANGRNISEAYGYYKVSQFDDVTVSFGKMVSWVGLDSLRARDNFNNSRTYSYVYGSPSNHTGVAVQFKPTNKVQAGVYVVNGWDDQMSDNNRGKTVGVSVRAKPISDLALGYNLITGPEEAGSAGDIRTVHNFTATYDVDTQLTVAGELVIGRQEDAGATLQDAKWTGWQVLAKYKVSSTWYLAPRLEVFDDNDAYLVNNTHDQRITSMTITSGHDLGDGLEGRLEFRHEDSSWDEAFQEDTSKTTDTQDTLLAAILYSI